MVNTIRPDEPVQRSTYPTTTPPTRTIPTATTTLSAGATALASDGESKLEGERHHVVSPRVGLLYWVRCPPAFASWIDS
jgi:hypothetical protein